MDPSSMMGGAGGGGGGIGGVLGGYGKGVAASQAAQHGGPPPLQMQQQQPFRQNQPGPVMAPMMQGQPTQITPPPQAQPWGINIGTDNDASHGYSSAVGKMAGNAARASSLQTAISNFHQAQALGNQAPPQSIQTQGAQQQPQPSLAQLSRQLQADTAQESAAQQYQSNPNYQWASQQPVNPANVQDMNDAEDYVNQNAYTPAGLFGGDGG